ncbi:hypothetical protein [Oceanobacillus timonensis]|uniref:hypothetical protein n=1 Tax=Oceanobacillus timonensis TaxID=1926285 RepID=UPI0009BA4C45|nr:hypothetical protein [Oceanobacillus timonensis]
MAKVTQKERKKNKEIAKQIMEFYDINYNDWLHQMHSDYIDEHLMDYMKEQSTSSETPSSKTEEVEVKNSDNKDDVENGFNS